MAKYIDFMKINKIKKNKINYKYGKVRTTEFYC